MPLTAPALVTVAAEGFEAIADHVPPNVMAVNVAVVIGEQILWSLPASGFRLRITETVSVHVSPPLVTE